MATSVSDYAACRFVKDRTLTLKTEAGSQPWYNGVVVTEDNLMVIDNIAWNLQIYRLVDGKLVYTSHRLEDIPMDVCLISKTEVSVCLWNSMIVILSFKSIDDVKRVNTFNVKTGVNVCQSVAKWNEDKLIVSGMNRDDAMLYWCVVNLTDGRVHSTHKVCRVGLKLGDSHVAIKNDTVYISCRTSYYTDRGVYAFDILNPHTPKFVYQHDGFIPTSILVDERNFIYVCDYYSNSIHQLTDSGQLVTTHTLSSIPHGIFYDDQHGVLYTTRWGSNVITVYRLEYSHQPGVPIEILNMDNRSIQLFEEALKDGKETVHNMRIMVVGHIGVGKTTLVKRLLGEEVNISERCSTEGIDVYVNCCDVSLSTHEWTRQAKDSEQDYRLQRLARVLNEQQSMKDKASSEKQDIIPPQRETTHKSHKVTQIDVEGEESEVLYIRSPQHDIGRDLSSTDSQQEESPSSLAQSVTIQSETNMVAMLKLLQENVYKLKQDTDKTSPLTIWDFAGQYAFYTTHQTFLTRRAIYLLVSDVSQQLTDLVADECYFDSDGIMKCMVHELIEVWLNYIHSCSPSPESKTPPVILVGTHVDKISQKQSSARGKESETKSITSETEEFTTASTPATASNEQPRALTIFGSVIKFLKPQKTKGIVEVTSVSSMTGAHALPADIHQKKQKSRFWSGRKKTLKTGGMAVVSTEKPTGEMILDANAEKTSQHEICEKYFRKIRTYLKDKPTRFHLVDEDFAINNTIVDSKLQDLKRKIVEVASQQPYWGEQIPARWLLLEQELMRLKAAGIKVIPRSLVEDLSQAGAVKISTEELDLFLRFQHDIGTVLYFSMDILKDKIMLDPQWMIDALKSLITAEMFVLRSNPAVTDKWFEFKNKGKLSQELVDVVWTKEKHQDLHDNKGHILLLMEQLNIIAKLRIYNEEASQIKVENCFLAPCMLNQKTPIEVINPVPHPQMESSSVICYVFMGKYLPSPIFHRLLAACVAYWPIATKMNKGTLENLIFCGCCVFQLDHYHKLTIHFRDYIIFLRVTRKGIKVTSPSLQLCIEAREFVSVTLTKIIGCLGQSLKFEQFIQCPEYKGDSVNSLIPVSMLKENQEVCCTCHDNVMESDKLLRFWFDDKASQGEKGGDTGKHVKVNDIPSDCQGSSRGNGGDTENTDIQDQILLQDHDVRTISSKTCQTKGI
ncbi:hypothetical protein CHS0354_024989 [Potamilus streckersoni]|uniref:non-specific serine/threonine protein kinase n=1 Tax=Potamilus streckersoni TaxID=2493646 RepID=A0AAE0W5C4_9BIVA|nr:hypothetical protein CHS0354_024989 [Potamilus streckersoni]